MLSAGMLTLFASAMIVLRRGLVLGSPPPARAATVSSLMMRVKILPRLASAAPFLCLIECHFEWPDMFETPEKSTRSDGNLITTRADPAGDAPGESRPAPARPRAVRGSRPARPRR